MQNVNSPVYENRMRGKDKSKMAQAVVLPLAVFFLCIITISIFKNFGKGLLSPIVGAMWAIGAGCALYMPSHRRAVITETLTMIAAYCGAMLGLRQLIAITSGISSEMLMASFGQPLAQATANTIPGYLQTLLYITSVMMPIGYITMEAKRIMQFRRTSSKERKLEQLRGVRMNE